MPQGFTLEANGAGGKVGQVPRPAPLERKIMTERCKDLVEDRWKDRQKDIGNNEFEPLGFDYVEPHTFEKQPEGYWRWQFSWGGPSDELRGYVNEHKELHRLEYWYLDWGDGAKLEVQPGPEWDEMQEMIGAS